MFAALLDTSVLWPSRQRDFLLSLAIHNLYRPLWSERILDELWRAERCKHGGRHGKTPHEAENAATHLVDTMRQAFDDAVVTGWEPLEGTYGLRDPDDEHVIAAAVMGGAGAIVTADRDFSEPKLIHQRIKILKPQEFAADTVAVNPEAAAQAVLDMSARLVRPAEATSAVLSRLEVKYGMTEAVELIRPVLANLAAAPGHEPAEPNAVADEGLG